MAFVGQGLLQQTDGLLAAVCGNDAGLFVADGRQRKGLASACGLCQPGCLQESRSGGPAIADRRFHLAQPQPQPRVLRPLGMPQRGLKRQCAPVQQRGMLMRQRTRRMFGRLLRVEEGLLQLALSASLVEVVRQLRQALAVIGVGALFQQLADAPVQPGALRRRHPLIQRFAHQRVAEAPAGGARQRFDQAGADGFLQAFGQRRLAALPLQCLEQRQVEDAADAGGCSQGACGGRLQRRQALGDDIAHAVRHAAQRLASARAGPDRPTRLRQQAHRFHQVQRVAFGARMNGLAQRRIGDAGSADEAQRFFAAQPGQRQAAKVRRARQLGKGVDQRRRQIGSVVAAGDEHHQRSLRRIGHQELQQLQRAWVGTVHVVQHQQARLPCRSSRPEAGHRVVHRETLAGLVA